MTGGCDWWPMLTMLICNFCYDFKFGSCILSFSVIIMISHNICTCRIFLCENWRKITIRKPHCICRPTILPWLTSFENLENRNLFSYTLNKEKWRCFYRFRIWQIFLRKCCIIEKLCLYRESNPQRCTQSQAELCFSVNIWFYICMQLFSLICLQSAANRRKNKKIHGCF